MYILWQECVICIDIVNMSTKSTCFDWTGSSGLKPTIFKTVAFNLKSKTRKNVKINLPNHWRIKSCPPYPTTNPNFQECFDQLVKNVWFLSFFCRKQSDWLKRIVKTNIVFEIGCWIWWIKYKRKYLILTFVVSSVFGLSQQFRCRTHGN